MKLKLDAYTLRLFVAVAHAGSIAQAARAAHISPSALSRRIAELEDTLRAPVFIRSPRGLDLTEAGRFVLGHAERINAEIESLVREVAHLGEGELRGHVRLHTNPAALIGALPERLRRFGERHPQVSLSIVEDDTHRVVRACLEGDADLGVGVSGPIPPGLERWSFVPDAVHVVTLRDHPLAAADGPLTFAQVLDYPVIGYRAGGALDGLVRAHGRRRDPGFHPRLTVGSFDAICRMIESGLGVALMPASALRAYAGSARFASRALDDDWARARSLDIYALRRTPQPPAVLALIGLLRETSDDAAAPPAPG
ncbi:LysR family transcriptional regulator [Luteimonas sp. FCS-9]|uniref:LysR family transcriptional regulator n=1 Tax=Luteimonas sp. FCS-9 TaxID=1547516 RepID=UPI00063E995F|nr:LysR family transcriptional regulator [Luteimonas sp. FCS-9]KLJ01049.1 hypothetical protein WQ56_07395 [Luteimonas sp. FCS-9]